MPYSGGFQLLLLAISQLSDKVKAVADPARKTVRAFGAVTVVCEEARKLVVLEWEADPINDMYADAVLLAVLQHAVAGETTQQAK